MLDQTVLPFKLEATPDSITPHAGLALCGEFLRGLKIAEAVDAQLPPREAVAVTIPLGMLSPCF